MGLRSGMTVIAIAVGDEAAEGLRALFGKSPNSPALCLFVIGGKTGADCGPGTGLVHFPASVLPEKLSRSVADACDQLVRIRQARDRLFSALVQRENLEQLLSICEDELGNPCVSMDLSAKLIGGGMRFWKWNHPGTLWDSVRERGYFVWNTQDDVKQFLQATRILLNNLTARDAPFFLIPDEFPEQPRRLVFKLIAFGRMAGHCMVMESDKPFAPEDEEILRIAAQVIGLALERETSRPLDADADSAILLELYNGAFSSLQELKQRTAFRNWKLEGTFILLSLDCSSLSKTTGMVPATLFAETLRWQFASGNGVARIYSVTIHERMLFLLALADPADVRPIRKTLRELMESERLRGVLSPPFVSPLDLRKTADFNDRLLDVGKTMGVCGLMEMDELFFPLMAEELRKVSPHWEYYFNEVNKIHHLDQLHGTDFHSTIYTYLDTGRSITETANRLFLHRNTVVRRIERFTEIVGRDLNSGEWPYRLYMAFKMEEYNKKIEEMSGKPDK